MKAWAGAMRAMASVFLNSGAIIIFDECKKVLLKIIYLIGFLSLFKLGLLALLELF